MIDTRMHSWLLALLTLDACVASKPSTRATPTVSDESPISLINQLRGVHPLPSNEANRAENQRLDQVWKKLVARKAEVLPVLREELRNETAKAHADAFFLLDASRFLELNDPDSRDLIFAALEKIDPAQPVIKANFEELFQVAFALADGSEANQRLLVALDRLFLLSDVTVFVPAHNLKLGGSLLCAFLYGPFGAKAESHLASMIEQSPKHTERIVEMLNWIGSPRSLEAVKRVLDHKPGEANFKMAIGVLMRVGGARGREIALQINPSQLDEASRKYYREARVDIEKMSYAFLLDAYKKGRSSADMPSADVLEKQLSTMYETYGRDGRASPLALLTAKLPKDQLVERLLKIRARMFRRLSDEAIDDVEAINQVIEALLLRPN